MECVCVCVCVSYVTTVENKRLLHFLHAFAMCSLATFVVATNNLACLQNCVKQQLSSSCPFVCLSVLTEQAACHWTGLLEIWCWVFSKNLSRNLKIHLNMTIITCILHEERYISLINYCSIYLRMKNISDKFCRDNQNKHSIFNIFPP